MSHFLENSRLFVNNYIMVSKSENSRSEI